MKTLQLVAKQPNMGHKMAIYAANSVQVQMLFQVATATKMVTT